MIYGKYKTFLKIAEQYNVMQSLIIIFFTVVSIDAAHHPFWITHLLLRPDFLLSFTVAVAVVK